MTVSDWRAGDAALLAPLYAAEAARWRHDLLWETSPNWACIEDARRTGALPGFIATGADGRVRGWSYHLRHGDQVQVGGLVSSSREVTAQLLDAVWTSPEAQSASGALLFGPFDAPGLACELAARGVTVERYRYLVRALSCEANPGPTRPAGPRGWRPADLSKLASLLAQTYGPDRSRPFAPGGKVADWIEYLAQLLGTDACGAFAPALSAVTSDPAGNLDGVALVTRLAATTAHLAQLAVRPDAQACGLGSSLLADVIARSACAGYRTLTLLVSESNTRGGRLYERCGFTEIAAFLSGSIQHPVSE